MKAWCVVCVDKKAVWRKKSGTMVWANGEEGRRKKEEGGWKKRKETAAGLLAREDLSRNVTEGVKRMTCWRRESVDGRQGRRARQGFGSRGAEGGEDVGIGKGTSKVERCLSAVVWHVWLETQLDKHLDNVW